MSFIRNLVLAFFLLVSLAACSVKYEDVSHSSEYASFINLTCQFGEQCLIWETTPRHTDPHGFCILGAVFSHRFEGVYHDYPPGDVVELYKKDPVHWIENVKANLAQAWERDLERYHKLQMEYNRMLQDPQTDKEKLRDTKRGIELRKENWQTQDKFISNWMRWFDGNQVVGVIAKGTLCKIVQVIEVRALYYRQITVVELLSGPYSGRWVSLGDPNQVFKKGGLCYTTSNDY